MMFFIVIMKNSTKRQISKYCGAYLRAVLIRVNTVHSARDAF